MAREVINNGTGIGARDGEPVRESFGKANRNFAELYGEVASLKQANADATGLAGQIAALADQILPSSFDFTRPSMTGVQPRAHRI